ncbi:MAG TPA: FG-GAP-like repeat-containing protein, partial [Pirellulales bacterium]|nr:FG-GAP-like repeat-containing protein [Pirellulales bacterium]
MLAVESNNLRANYCLGILLFNDSKMPEALGHFKLVADADPHDAFAAYFVGRCLFVEQKFADALAAYEQALGDDPYLQSAYFAEFQALQRLGKVDEAKAKLGMFQRIAKNPQAETVDIKYTRMGPKAMAMTVDAMSRAPEPKPPLGLAFGNEAGIAGVPLPLVAALPANVAWAAPNTDSERRVPSITVCDIDGDGQLDLFIAGGLTVRGQRFNAVLLRRGDKWQLDVDHPLAKVPNVSAALWGDYDNDGLTDVYLCRKGANQLWRQTAKNKWEDVTERTHTAGQGGTTIDGAMYDADHDGDLDLFLIHSDGPNELLINNGDGTFRSNAKEQGIAGDGRPAIGLVVAPLGDDRVADIIVLHDKPPHEVF